MFTNMYKHKSHLVYISLKKGLSLIDIVTEEIGSVLHRITEGAPFMRSES